ncbi:hypothetical protein SpCBS45565_g04225 [Spizellomyces sp. 'palustris']|nr:hypothetical protein SpCBS45565_g04225 [Spizellomyces sp. 'palustris']
MGTVSRQYGLVSRGAKVEKVTLDDLNEYIAHCLAGLVLPTTEVKHQSGKLEYKRKPSALDAWNVVAELTPVPSCKMATFASSAVVSGVGNIANEFTLGWDSLRTNLMRNLASMPIGTRRRCIAARLQARGVIGPEYWQKSAQFEQKFVTKLGVVNRSEWFDVKTSSLYALDIKSPKRSLDVCYNGSDVIPVLDSMLTKAGAMYKAGAYLHWYERYGGSEVAEVFSDCFEIIQTANDAYTEILGSHL